MIGDSTPHQIDGCNGRTIALTVLSSERATPRIRASKSGPRRAAVLIVVHLIFAAHLAHWYFTGRTVSPVEPSESMQTLESGAVNAGAIFFAVAILATALFGRFFCGWGCHIVALQDLCGWIMKKCGVRPKPFRSRLLVYVPLVLALYMFVWPTVKRVVIAPLAESWWPSVRADLLIGTFPDRGFSNHLMTEGFWDTFSGPIVAIPFLLVCGFATVYFLGAKGFCTYGCPYGGIFGPVDLITPGKIIVNSDACHQCGHCTAVCTSNVRVHDEIREYGMVVDPGCMKCMDCVSVCPNDALSFGFTKPALMKGKPKTARPRRVFDTTLGEDLTLALVFAGVFLAWRGAYGLVAMLFAVGIAGCVTFLAWKSWRALKDHNARFSIWQLKRRGRLQISGACFVALTLLCLGLSAQSGMVTMQRWRGDSIYDQIAVDKARVLMPGQPPLDDAVKASARAALQHYALTRSISDGGLGLFSSSATELRSALMMLVAGNPEQAEKTIRRVIDRAGPSDELVADLGRLIVLNGREAEAEAFYERMLSQHPEFWSVREQWAIRMLQSGNGNRALQEAQAALTLLPPERFTRTAHARTRLILARLNAAAGNGEEALTQIAEAARVRPDDPIIHETVAALVYQVRGDAAMAVAAMRRAYELEPSNTLRLLQLARLELETGDFARSRDHFDEAVQREPVNLPRREEIARLFDAVGRRDDASHIRELK